MFFRRKAKPKENKKGCLNRLIYTIIFVVIIGIIVVVAINRVFKEFDIPLSQLKTYAEWLNEDVNEKDIVTSPIKEEDLNTFNQKANDANFGVYDVNNNINLNLNYYSLDSSITLYDYEIGAMLNAYMSTQSNNIYKLLQINIVLSGSGTYTMTTVAKISLKSIKESIESNVANIPDTIYITNTAIVETVGSRIQTRDNKIKINNLSDDKNEKIVSFLNSIENESDSNESITDINNQIVTDILSDVARKSDSKPQLGNHTLTLVKNAE